MSGRDEKFEAWREGPDHEPYSEITRPAAPAAEVDLRELLDRLEWRYRNDQPRPPGQPFKAGDSDVLAMVAALRRLVAEAAEARRLRETVARVEALADTWRGRAVESNGWLFTTRDQLRRALDGTDG